MAVLQQELTLGEAADQLARALPGHRVEILQGRLTVTPPPDGSHQLALTKIGRAFDRAGIAAAGYEYVQGVGLGAAHPAGGLCDPRLLRRRRGLP
ncbi:hypothetical protein ACI3K5_07845 [Streptomyces sp. MPA0124]|uniref:hypothetical protein n=1 Tax=Streptomyces sp. MPA0124 TaxID=3378069 RepID=UPI003854B989